MCDQPSLPIRPIAPRLALRVSYALAFMLFAIALAACRSATPVVDVATAEPTVAPLASPTPEASPRPTATAAPPALALAPTPAPPLLDYCLELSDGWEFADVAALPESAEDYEFALMLPTGVDNAPAAIATGMLVPTNGLDLPTFIDAAANELAQLDGAQVISTSVDGLLRADGRPVGVLDYTLDSHAQLGRSPRGRQYALASPDSDQLLVLTCLATAAMPDHVAACDAIMRSVLFD